MGDITARYLEQARSKLTEQLGTKVTDYRLAKQLSISTTAMHAYLKTDRECDDDDLIFSIAHYAQIDPMQIIGAIRAKKAKNTEVKALWEKVSKGAIAGFGAVSLAGALSFTPSDSYADSPTLSKSDNSIYYVKFNILLQRLISYVSSLTLWHANRYTPAFH